MKAITKFLAAGAGIAALAAAAPAAAQYFPGYGAPYGNSYPGYGNPGYGNHGYGNPAYGNPGYGYGAGGAGYGGYGYNVPGGSQVAANQCSAAVQQRLGGYGNGYGYGQANGRILGIDSVEIRSGGGYRVQGTAAANGYAYGGGSVRFSCRTDPRGYVVDVNFNNRQYGNGYPGNGYPGNGYPGNGNYGSNYDNPYSAYGYQRY
jgi:hypothetical protein